MQIEISIIIILCVVAFLAGFVDAISGGGGLIQTPALLVLLPAYPVSSVLATVKLPSFSGTFFAARQFLKKVKLQLSLIALMCPIAFFASYTGSYLLLQVNNQFMKPLLLIILVIVAIYTFSKKNFGQKVTKYHTRNKKILLASTISLVIGFYDGFIGPGAGSFLILAFVGLLGMDFLHASAYSKMVNLATNLASLMLFSFKGSIIWKLAIPMAICNALGGFLGARMAIVRGNKFIRYFFLAVVIATMLRFAYDVFYKN
jgi:uncharacterized protein